MSGSNQIPQLITVSKNSQFDTALSKWNFKLTNWSKFCKLCFEVPHINLNQDIDLIIFTFTNIVYSKVNGTNYPGKIKFLLEILT